MKKKYINVGLIGYGTVGKGVVKILGENKKIVLRKVGKPICIKSICDLKPIDKPELYVKNFRDIIKDPEIDLIVELIGGYEPARTVIIESLKAGKNVVSANKAVLAKYWDQIFTTAQIYQKSIYYEASVGGVIPVVQGLSEGLASEEVFEIKGILNGTTNFILSEMKKHCVPYEEALKSAQKAGYAEANPSFDVDGIDTANKLAILASLAWGSWIKVKNIPLVKGIADLDIEDILITQDFGYDVKLIGSAQKTKDGIDMSVQPCLINYDHAFTTVENEYNAIMITGKDSGDVLFYGKGAGQQPAASAVVSDIINLSKSIITNTVGIIPDVVYDSKKKIKILPIGKSKSPYYLRFAVIDKAGVLSKISGILAEFKVSIARSLAQLNINGTDYGRIIIITHETHLEDLEKALKQINATKSIVKHKTVKIKIEV
ncbi:homoserine dehydrogenase [Candidatus Endomicrobiellum agilis]|uniref:homoserine dehydrogenase n=1 Tax=Candidatus Endomicrobiellum agilis TaxID=3238957 RepID=UPI00357E8FDA|nr:homoserine dehydrogenase [Endomicrobium sp.]MCA6084697.1 homoserine dehydrogenase [Endomicrobium sp.]